VSLGLGAALLACDSAVTAPAGAPPAASGYRQTNLVADLPGIAGRNDPNFRNPWGLAFAPGEPFWISNNQLGTARVFGPAGNPETPVGVVVPPPAGSRLRSTPTGIAFNPIPGDFHASGHPAQFLFATEDGTISTWATINGNLPSAGVLAVDRSADGAVFTGLAILAPACCHEFLAVTDFHGGSVATFTASFNRLATAGNFTDPQLPAGHAPFNIQPIGGKVLVTYALRNATGRAPVAGPGNGIVDVFAPDGTFLRRFASNGVLNAPWGVVQASQDFGPFSHAILIGNFR
jgi:uncharacterized protein (TIGR03118 family)